MSEIQPILRQDETILRTERARRYVARYATSGSNQFLPGQLWLTDQRLIFHNGLEQTAYPLYNIVRATEEPFTLEMIDHLRIQFDNEGIECFMVKEQPAWAEAINLAKDNAPPLPDEFNPPPTAQKMRAKTWILPLAAGIFLALLVLCLLVACVLLFILR